MSRTHTPALTDRSMWRKLIARTHPDAGGSDELFVWTTSLKEHVTDQIDLPQPNSRHELSPRCETDSVQRVPFDPDVDHYSLTEHALVMAEHLSEPHRSMLMKLSSCGRAYDPFAERRQRRGAPYKMLAAAAHRANLTKRERTALYRIAERIPLSEGHVKHILDTQDGVAT